MTARRAVRLGRGVCPLCRRTIATRADRTIASQHYTIPPKPGSPRELCPGFGCRAQPETENR